MQDNTPLSGANNPRLPFVSQAIGDLILIAVILFTIWLGISRLVTGDEGYYLYAAQLVAQGKTPYFDFFFPQMPLVPYFYSIAYYLAVPWGVEYIWVTARGLSIALTLGIVTTLFLALRRQTGFAWALLAVCLLACATNAYPVYVTVQTYALATLCAFLAFIAADTKSACPRFAFLSGLCLALAIITRLPIAAITPLVLAQVWSRSAPESRKRNLCACVIGMGVGFLPLIPLALPDLRQFWFDNFGYHMVRDNLSNSEITTRRLKLLGALVGTRESGAFAGYQFALLLWTMVVAFIVTRIKRLSISSSSMWAALYALLLIAVHFTPSPPYLQYFSHALPFLIFACISLLATLPARVRLAALPVLVLYMWPVPENVRTYTGAEKVRGMRRGVDPKDWAPLRFVEAARAVNTHSTPHAPAISFWAGFYVGTHLTPAFGTENHFARATAAKMDQERRQRLSIQSSKGLYQSLATRAVPYFLESPDPGRGIRQKSLETGGYRSILTAPPVELWKTE